MLNIQNRKAFTLIELLVVITIIGILATAGIGIFTTQLQKSRDSSRVTDMKMYQTALSQYYSDKSEYPEATSFTAGLNASGTGGIKTYVSIINQDPREGKGINCRKADATGQDCHYKYDVVADASSIALQSYKIATTLENQDNVRNLAKDTVDAGNTSDFLEYFGGDTGPTINIATAGTIITR